MEIRVDVLNSKLDLLMSSYFLFVSRNKDDHKLAHKVPKLELSNEFDVDSAFLRYEIGEQHQGERKSKRLNSVSNVPPTGEEISH